MWKGQADELVDHVGPMTCGCGLLGLSSRLHVLTMCHESSKHVISASTMHTNILDDHRISTAAKRKGSITIVLVVRVLHEHPRAFLVCSNKYQPKDPSRTYAGHKVTGSEMSPKACPCRSTNG